jgi:hypothetical protein
LKENGRKRKRKREEARGGRFSKQHELEKKNLCGPKFKLLKNRQDCFSMG